MADLKKLSELFLRSRVAEYQKGNFNAIDLVLLEQGIAKEYEGQSYLSALKGMYSIMMSDYKNEYIVKNQFINNWLGCADHHDNSIILNELKMGPATLDLLIVSSTSRAYEIKTALDSDHRLKNQLEVYNKVFNEVSVVFPMEHYSRYKAYASEANLVAYNDSVDTFEIVSQVSANRLINTDSLMLVLHTGEYMDVVNSYYRELPPMNDFNRFDICKEMIRCIPFAQLNPLVLSAIKGRGTQIKSRRINNFFYGADEHEFNQVALALNLNEHAGGKLLDILRSTLVINSAQAK